MTNKMTNKTIINQKITNQKMPNKKMTNQKITNKKMPNKKITNKKIINQKITQSRMQTYKSKCRTTPDILYTKSDQKIVRERDQVTILKHLITFQTH